MPQAILFPANKPSSRADATILNQWVSSAFTNYAQRAASTSQEAKAALEEDMSQAVEELVPVLSIGLHEIVRQVMQHCLERGVVLEKIWRTYVELFERALAETRAALRRHRDRTIRVEAELERTRAELQEVKVKHPEQLDRLSATLAGKFSQRQTELAEQLTTVRNENRALKQHLDEQTTSMSTWYPLFDRYKDSAYRKAVFASISVSPVGPSPEAKLAADFKRILIALPPEARRRVSFFVGTLLGLRGNRLGAVTVEALQERREHNKSKIERLEAQLKELKGDAMFPSPSSSRVMRLPSERAQGSPAGAGANTPGSPASPSSQSPAPSSPR